jgi:hypothetical protein
MLNIFKKIIKNDTKHNLFPTSMAFEPIQVCNANCYCCPYTWLSKNKEYTKQKMNNEQIINLIDIFGSIRKKFNYQGPLRISPYRYSDPLACKNLDLILKQSKKYNLLVSITTNAVSLNYTNIKLLKKYQKQIEHITISIIGHDENSVNQRMGISLEKTKKNILFLKEIEKSLLSVLKIHLRYTENTLEEKKGIEELKQFFNDNLTKKNVTVQNEWLSNRIDYDMKSFNTIKVIPRKINEKPAKNFVIGCQKRITSRLEVMVNGDVVLCCDDSENLKCFGNIFKEDLEIIWHRLVIEHNIIFEKKYINEKQDLICNTCSRAIRN